MDRRLWILLPATTVFWYAVWGGLMDMIIARQVVELVPDARTSAAIMGAIMAIGATLAVIAQPVLGSLSDRTTDRFLGRRNNWILGGSIVTAAILVIMAFNTSVVGLGILFAAVVFVYSGAHASFNTFLPERVPVDLQGKMSGICGSMTYLGVMLGINLTGLAPSTRVGYLLLAGLLIPVATTFAIATRNPGCAELPVKLVSGWRAMVSNLPGLRSHRDFWLTFLSRCMLMLAYNIVIGFNIFIVKDYLHVGGGNLSVVVREATKVISLGTGVLIIFSSIGGFLCDKLGRVRDLVIVSALMILPSAGLLACVSTMWGYYGVHALLGAAFGIYMAVDGVLMARVLPRTGNAARDLGILGVANSAPQAIAPMMAGATIALTGSFEILFGMIALVALASAVAAKAIRSVR